MRLTLRQLEAFVHVADFKSVTAAAEKMGLTQPSVSGLIRELEQAFRANLLDRTTRSVQLTEAGRTVLRRARIVLSETGTLIDELRELRLGSSGIISIAATTAVSASLLPRILVDIQTEMPELKIVVHDVHLENLIATVLNGVADFAIGAVTKHPDLEIRRLVSDALALVVPAGSPLSSRSSITWLEAARERTITIRSGNVVTNTMNAALQMSDVDFIPTLEVNMIATALSMTAEGFGYAILPPFLMRHMRAGNFDIVRLVDPVVPQQISIFSKKNKDLSASARLSKSIVVDHFEKISTTS